VFDHVELPQRKDGEAIDLDKMKMSGQLGAMVPTGPDEIIYRVDPSSGVSVLYCLFDNGDCFNGYFFASNSPQVGLI
jgi:hypothetical protein